jgi:hypothetical protein
MPGLSLQAEPAPRPGLFPNNHERAGRVAEYVKAWTRKLIVRDSKIGHGLRFTTFLAVWGYPVRRINCQRRDFRAAENPSFTAGFLYISYISK